MVRDFLEQSGGQISIGADESGHRVLRLPAANGQK